MAEGLNWAFPEARILVFAKSPFPGQVKTRLAAAIGPQEAARSYAQWLEQQVQILCRARLAPVEVWISPDTQYPLFQRLRDALGVSLHQQPAGDLGQRMLQVFQHTLEQHQTAILIGTDCPVMEADYVRRALNVLATGVSVVFGPAEDGGYVLIGQNRLHPELFNDIPWSSDQVMRRSRQQLMAARQEWAELETLWDIDTIHDYQRWQNISSHQVEGHT